jgi:hypothetical protein
MAGKSWTRRAIDPAWTLAALLLALLGVLPVLTGHLAPDEYAWLERAAVWTPDASPHGGLGAAELEPGGAPLAGLALFGLARAIPPASESVLGVPPALWYRLVSLFVLLAAALATSRFARRALLPWIGAESAAAAARAALVLVLVHPVAAASVATLTRSGALLSTALAAASAAVFLAGRQDRRPLLLVPALALAVASGSSGGEAWPLALIAAASEFASARRYRPLLERLRTTGTTLVGFAACAALRLLLPGETGRGLGWPFGAAELASADALGKLTEVAEAIGALVIPARANEPIDVFVGGALVLVALQPGVQAARAAPRLWALLALAWLGTVLASAVLGWDPRVAPPGARPALVSAAGCAVWVGLAVSASALSGWPRAAAVGTLALGLTALSFRISLAWRASEARFAVLRAELAAAAELHGRDARFLVLDPPRAEAAVPGADLGAIMRLDAPDGAPDSDPQWPWVAGLTTPAFLALARSGELDAWRAGGCVVLVPEGVLAADRGGRAALRLPAPEPTSGATSWRGVSRSPDLDVEALGPELLVVEASIGERPDSLPPLCWRPTEASAAGLELAGAWSAPAPGSEARYDLAGSLAWRLSGRVRRVWLEGALARLEHAEFAARPPDPWAAEPPVEPARDGDDWVFPAPLDAALAGAEWSCSVLALERLDLSAHPAAAEGDGGIRVPGASTRAAEPLYWELDCRRDGRLLARGRGRLDPRREQ